MFTPKNEMGVVVAFAQQAHLGGIEILKAQIRFPDMILRFKNKNYRAELEFLASNFLSHCHDPERCDWIICWQNDLSYSPLPIIELSDPGWYGRDFWIIPSGARKIEGEYKKFSIRESVQSASEQTIEQSIEHRRKQLLSILGEHGDLGATEFAKRLNVKSRNTIYSDLQALADSQLVHKNGNGWEVGAAP